MKYKASEVTTPLDDMELGKISINVKGEDNEGIWVKSHGDKCYLQNHALAFYPFASWGLELPNQSSVDISDIRGESPDDAVLTIHPEAFKSMVEAAYINDEGIWIKEN